jgi:hypothetical protein
MIKTPGWPADRAARVEETVKVAGGSTDTGGNDARRPVQTVGWTIVHRMSARQ